MNVPKLRFKDNNGNDYPEWEKKKLGDIGNVISGGTPSSSNEEYWNGNIDWFTPSEIGKTKFVSESIRKITVKGLNNSSAKLLPKGTILLSSRATIGEKSILLNSATTNQGFQSIITNNKVVNEFIYYYIDTLKNELIRQSSGSTFLEISNTMVKKLKIYIPLLEEQQKIADFLSTVDKKIENINDTIENLEQQKKGLIQQIFNQKLRFKDENGNDYPQWQKKKLGNVSDVRDGTHDSPKYISNGYPLITSKNIQNGKINFNNINYISEQDFHNINKRSKVSKGDIIMGMIGTIGNVALLTQDNFAIKNVALFKEKSGLINPFLFHYLQSDSFKKSSFLLNDGGTQKFISLKNLRNLYFSLPCLEEQTKIANFLSTFDRKIDNQKAQLEHWQQIKKGLLQQMFI